MDKLQRFFDWMLSERLRAGSPDQVRRAKVIVGSSFLNAAWGPIYAYVFHVLGLRLSALLTPLVMVMMASTALVLRRTDSVRLAGNWQAGQLYIILTMVMYESGGLDSVAVSWGLLVPLFALLAGDARDAVAWLVVLLVSCTAFAVGQTLELLPPSRLDPRFHTWFDLGLVAGAASLLVSISWYAEKQRSQTQAALHEAQIRAEEARQAARHILDNVHEGLFIVDASGTVQPGHSTVAAEWLGEPEPDCSLWAWVSATSPSVALRLEMEWQQILDGFLPIEVVLAQLPVDLQRGDSTLQLEYLPLIEGEHFTGMLITLVDVTAQRKAARAEAMQRDVKRIVERYAQDRSGVLEFLRETQSLLEVVAEGTGVRLARALHTLKGNAGLVGLHFLSDQVHMAESALMEGADWHRVELLSMWSDLYARVGPLFRLDEEPGVCLSRETLAHWNRQLALPDVETVRSALAEHLTEPASLRLERLAIGARALAERLGKGPLVVEVDDGGVRLAPDALNSVWANLVHVVRNCVDHGLPEDGGTLRLRAQAKEEGWTLEVSDDGVGIDWERVAMVARDHGLPADTHAERVAALFVDGVSTREAATPTSGRGVGLAAVLEAVQEVGGALDVESAPDEGTRFLFTLPHPIDQAWSPEGVGGQSACGS